LAGTIKRGNNAKEDKFYHDELANNPKEKAEHSMLIDLLRNDLSKNCEP
jgi:anthranilate/para-aminobenzoate synthase component I